jgi:hypothetical protein
MIFIDLLFEEPTIITASVKLEGETLIFLEVLVFSPNDSSTNSVHSLRCAISRTSQQ